MDVISVKTRALTPPKDDLLGALKDTLPKLQNGDILVLASKAVAIHEGRCVPIEGTDREALIKSEADKTYPRPHDTTRIGMTRKGNILVPFAGVDESNGNGHYVLWPEAPHDSAENIRNHYSEKFGLENFAVIIADSTFLPFRSGNLSVAIGFFGLEPVRDYRGKKDLFGREIRLTQSNRVDPLAALAGLYLGEGDESTPAVLLRGFPGVVFTTRPSSEGINYSADDDFYSTVFK
ncbi:MAG: coenzyme F420-0:L-glutamate ligase [bacterium]|nr:coenzyme F420-0:L-glutamate ligase [bacterium]